MLVTGDDTIAGHRIVKTLGTVGGHTISSQDMISVSSQKDSCVTASKNSAIQPMIDQAETMGGNAIVAVRFTPSYVMATGSGIVVSGTAVIIAPEPDKG